MRFSLMLSPDYAIINFKLNELQTITNDSRNTISDRRHTCMES